jgi:hypothetical protein
MEEELENMLEASDSMGGNELESSKRVDLEEWSEDEVALENFWLAFFLMEFIRPLRFWAVSVSLWGFSVESCDEIVSAIDRDSLFRLFLK